MSNVFHKVDIERFLQMTDSKANISRTMKVIIQLINGESIRVMESKFKCLDGIEVNPSMMRDVAWREDILDEFNKIAPCEPPSKRIPENIYDKSNGWMFKHPWRKLIQYIQWVYQDQEYNNTSNFKYVTDDMIRSLKQPVHWERLHGICKNTETSTSVARVLEYCKCIENNGVIFEYGRSKKNLSPNNKKAVDIVLKLQNGDEVYIECKTCVAAIAHAGGQLEEYRAFANKYEYNCKRYYVIAVSTDTDVRNIEDEVEFWGSRNIQIWWPGKEMIFSHL